MAACSSLIALEIGKAAFAGVTLNCCQFPFFPPKTATRFPKSLLASIPAPVATTWPTSSKPGI